MPIRDQIDARLKQARRDRDERTRNVIGMLKNKVLTELKSGRGRQEDDALWLDTIAGYAKQLRKSIAEFEHVGDRGVEAKAEAEFELGFCEAFLPKKLDEAATEQLVRGLAREHGVTDPKMTGKLIGLVMKGHKDEVDGELVRVVVQRVLATD
jgi:uncharacterized protein YqeY